MADVKQISVDGTLIDINVPDGKITHTQMINGAGVVGNVATFDSSGDIDDSGVAIEDLATQDDLAAQAVTISQNTQTGGYDIAVGGGTPTNVAGQEETQNYIEENLSPLREAIVDNEDDAFSFADTEGNVIAKINKKGLNSKFLNIHGEVGKHIDIIANSGDGTYYFVDGAGNVIAKIDNSGIDAIGFGEHLSKVVDKGSKVINCIGDSITQGQTGLVSPSSTQTADHDYPHELQLLIPDYQVRNYGYGGNTPADIISSMGFSDIIVGDDFVLKADKSETAINSTNDLTDTFSNSKVGCLLTQFRTTYGDYSKDAQRYCSIYGIKCELRKTSEGYSDQKYAIKRLETGDSDINIKQGMVIRMQGPAEKNAIYTFFIGQNNLVFYTSDDFIPYMRKITSSVSTGKFIVIGIPQYSPSFASAVKAANENLRAEYGGRFIDLHEFFTSESSFQILGLTPTTDEDISAERYALGVRSDEYCLENGLLPSSYWRFTGTTPSQEVDSVHLNGVAYQAIAMLLKNRIIELGW